MKRLSPGDHQVWPMDMDPRFHEPLSDRSWSGPGYETTRWSVQRLMNYRTKLKEIIFG